MAKIQEIPAWVKGLEEFGRVAVLAALPVITDGVLNGFGWRQIAIVAGIAALKAVDKWLHKRASEEGWLREQGLAGF